MIVYYIPMTGESLLDNGDTYGWLIRNILGMSSENIHIISETRYEKDFSDDGAGICGVTYIAENVRESVSEECGGGNIENYLNSTVSPALQSFIVSELQQLSVSTKIDCLVSWINCPTVAAAAASFGCPVVYNELGAVRPPHYIKTAYFDLKGLFAPTESLERYRRYSEECGGMHQCFSSLDIVFKNYLIKPISIAKIPQNYEIGIALQTANVNSRGWHYPKLVEHVIQQYGRKNVLLRAHPTEPNAAREYGASVDDSKTSLEFIGKCKKIVTITSNVGAEALLWGKECEFFGDHPARFINEVAAEERTQAIVFFFMNYVIPHSMLHNSQYFLWRLGNPSETEIWNVHRMMYGHERLLCNYPALLNENTQMRTVLNSKMHRFVELLRHRIIDINAIQRSSSNIRKHSKAI